MYSRRTDKEKNIVWIALKKKEILIHAIIWIKLEDIRLSKISQLQKDKYYMIPFT